MVWTFVCFELLTNMMLDSFKVFYSGNTLEPKWLVFASLITIGSVIPISTKFFAEELTKTVRFRQRNSRKYDSTED